MPASCLCTWVTLHFSLLIPYLLHYMISGDGFCTDLYGWVLNLKPSAPFSTVQSVSGSLPVSIACPGGKIRTRTFVRSWPHVDPCGSRETSHHLPSDNSTVWLSLLPPLLSRGTDLYLLYNKGLLNILSKTFLLWHLRPYTVKGFSLTRCRAAVIQPDRQRDEVKSSVAGV